MKVLLEDPPFGNPFEPTSPEDPFGALSEYDTCPRSPTEAPFGDKPKPCQKSLRSLLRKPLRAFLRRVSRILKASPEATFRNLLRNPLRTFLRSATRPEGQAESYLASPSKPPRETFRSYHRNTPGVPEYPTPLESLRMPPDLAP